MLAFSASEKNVATIDVSLVLYGDGKTENK